MNWAKLTDGQIINALRTGNGYYNYAAMELDCPEGVIRDRIRESREVAKVYWAIVRARKQKQGLPAPRSKRWHRRYRR